MDETPKRNRSRFFRFGLRSLLFVVTVVAVVLGYHANWIRQRQAAVVGWHTSYWTSPAHRIAKAPGLLRLFGERGYGALFRDSDKPLMPEDEALLARIKRLFPEATVTWQGQDD